MSARKQISIIGLIYWIVSFFCGTIGQDVNLLINRLAIYILFNLNDVVMLLSILLKLSCELEN